MRATRLLSAMVATWNNVPTAFTGIKLTVTNTASAAASRMIDLVLDAASVFYVTKGGLVAAFNQRLPSGGSLAWDSSGSPNVSPDTYILRDAPNTVALRNGTAAQALNVYGSYTDVSNRDYVSISKAAGGDVNISAQGVGTGFGGSIVFGVPLSGGAGVASSNVWKITQGNLIAVSTNAYDIGTSVTVGAPRNIYAGTNLSAGGALFTAGSKIAGQADGVFRFSNNAGTQTVDLTIGASNLLTLNGGLTANGNFISGGFLKSASYTVGTVPSASAAGAGAQIYVSDESGGAVPAFSDATNWRRVTDRAVIS